MAVCGDPNQLVAKLLGSSVWTPERAVDAALLVGLHTRLLIFLAPGDHHVDQAGELARRRGDRDGLVFRGSRARYLASMKVWLLRAVKGAMRSAGKIGLTTLWPGPATVCRR